MTNTRNLSRFATAGTLVLFSAVLGFNCAKFEVTGAPSFDLSQNPSSAGGEPPSPVALLSAEQMFKAMMSATGAESLSLEDITSTQEELVARTYSERSGSLPSGQDLKAATGPTLIAVTNLASAVCARVVDRDRAIPDANAASRLFFREMNFAAGVGSQSSSAVTSAFERLARNAWRRDATGGEVEAIVTFAQDFSANATNTSDPAETRSLSIATCAAVLSSIDALTY